MTLVAEKEYQFIGTSKGCEDHDHDLLHELSKWPDAQWRYDQYIANAEKHPEMQVLWREVKTRRTKKNSKSSSHARLVQAASDPLLGRHAWSAISLEDSHG